MTEIINKNNLPTSKSSHPAQDELSLWNINLEGEWTLQEIERVVQIFQRLSAQSGGRKLAEIFNGETTTLKHSGRPGRVGRTLGGTIYLDKDWTDWTFAHELGHRWNNAWRRRPQTQLRKAVSAGKLDGIKKFLRRSEKWLEQILKRLGFKGRLDWRALWYHPGKAAPPCGIDRNFNASEDLAESFAAMIFQEDAQVRAQRSVEKFKLFAEKWNWPSQFPSFSETPRGKSLKMLLENLSGENKPPDQAN